MGADRRESRKERREERENTGEKNINRAVEWRKMGGRRKRKEKRVGRFVGLTDER